MPQNQKHKAKLLPRYNQLSSIKFDQTYQLEMLKTVTKTTRMEISTCLFSMGFVAVSTLIKTHFHVFPPTPTWNLYVLTWNFFNTHPNWNTQFFLEHPPQVHTAVLGWNFKVTVLLGES